jgi:hypothetical protein
MKLKSLWLVVQPRLVRLFGRTTKPPVPGPIRTHGCAIFWHNHGCPKRIGDEIVVPMASGLDAVFRLSKVEPAAGVDWSWYDFDFVRYLSEPNA